MSAMQTSKDSTNQSKVRGGDFVGYSQTSHLGEDYQFNQGFSSDSDSDGDGSNYGPDIFDKKKCHFETMMGCKEGENANDIREILKKEFKEMAEPFKTQNPGICFY